MRAAALLLLLLLPAGAAAQDGDDTVTLKSDLVVVPVAVRHDKGGAVIDLRQEELSLSEDGAAQEIAFFNRDTAPVDVVLLVDSSANMSAMLTEFRAGLIAFLDNVPSDVEVAIISTGGQLRIRVPLPEAADRFNAARGLLSALAPG